MNKDCNFLIFRILIFGLTIIDFSAYVNGQNEFGEFKSMITKDIRNFKNSNKDNLCNFRNRINEEFAEFMKAPWKPMESSIKKDELKYPTPIPVIDDIQVIATPPIPIKFDKVVTAPKPHIQPEPVDKLPLEEIIFDSTENNNSTKIYFYGTEFEVRCSSLNGFAINGNRTSDFAESWKYLNKIIGNDLINDCIREREHKHLCDWAYIQFLEKIALEICADRNSSSLLTGYLLAQSGYKIRFAKSHRGELQIFYACNGLVYNTPSLSIDHQNYFLYGKGCDQSERLEVCDFAFPNEKCLSFEVPDRMDLSYQPTPIRVIEPKFHDDIKLEISVNQNVIDFFNSYPEVTLTSDPYSKWTLYANAPISYELERDLYPVLKEKIKGLSEIDAANLLMHLAESFPYGYDDEIWGRDRAFFPDETWFYPQSDCEDHAIHFTRLVRDLLELDALLVYYPGHLASAIAFSEEVSGDFVEYNNRRYTICDPTIFYANVGYTMPGLDNRKAVLIELCPDNHRLISRR